MANIFYDLIKRGKITIDDVPETLKADVLALMGE